MVPTVMHYCLPIGQFVKIKLCQLSSIQLGYVALYTPEELVAANVLEVERWPSLPTIGFLF